MDVPDIILYSTNCPKCKVLKQKLDSKGISYTINSSVEEMLDIGITNIPMLSVNDELLSFAEAVKWINQVMKGEDNEHTH